MEVTRQQLRWFVFIAGPLVLVSYVLGIARADEPADLWGGISEAEQIAVIPFMFVAAAGFLAYAYVLLFKMDDFALMELRWPWGASDGLGRNRAMLAYAMYLIPSMLWLETTLLHINNPQSWTQGLVILVLFAVGVGVVMLGLLGWAAHKDGVPGAKWLIAGAIGMGIQSIVNDLIIWVLAFPW